MPTFSKVGLNIKVEYIISVDYFNMDCFIFTVSNATEGTGGFISYDLISYLKCSFNLSNVMSILL